MGKIYFIEAVRRYRTAARRKGGDPPPFGRAREESAGLLAAGIEYEMAPRVSAAAPIPAGEVFEQSVPNRAEAEDPFQIYGESWFH